MVSILSIILYNCKTTLIVEWSHNFAYIIIRFKSYDFIKIFFSTSHHKNIWFLQINSAMKVLTVIYVHIEFDSVINIFYNGNINDLSQILLPFTKSTIHVFWITMDHLVFAKIVLSVKLLMICWNANISCLLHAVLKVKFFNISNETFENIYSLK